MKVLVNKCAYTGEIFEEDKNILHICRSFVENVIEK
jgi:hypothetical protein